MLFPMSGFLSRQRNQKFPKKSSKRLDESQDTVDYENLSMFSLLIFPANLQIKIH